MFSCICGGNDGSVAEPQQVGRKLKAEASAVSADRTADKIAAGTVRSLPDGSTCGTSITTSLGLQAGAANHRQQHGKSKAVASSARQQAVQILPSRSGNSMTRHHSRDLSSYSPATAAKAIATTLHRLASIAERNSAAISQMPSLLAMELAVNHVHLSAASDTESSLIIFSSTGKGKSYLKRNSLLSVDSGQQSDCKVVKEEAMLNSCTTDKKNWFPDWLDMANSGLKSFLAVPIKTENAVLGVLQVASTEEQAFVAEWWFDHINLLAAALVPYFIHNNLKLVVSMMESVNQFPSAYLCMSVVLHTIPQLLTSYMTKFGCRVGLLSSDRSRALVFEDVIVQQKARSGARALSGSKVQSPGASPAGTLENNSSKPETRAAGRLSKDQNASTGSGNRRRSSRRRSSRRASFLEPKTMGTFLNAENTLLLEAVEAQKPLLIPDCAIHMQRAEKPQMDIYLNPSEALGVVHSLLVFPLRFKDLDIGAIYLTATEELEGEKVKDELAAIVNMLAPILYDNIQNGTLGHELKQLFECETDSRNQNPASPEASTPTMQNMVNRYPTKALVQSMKEELWRNEGEEEQDEVQELHLQGRIGEGGFGTVYLGLWHGIEVAIKVIETRAKEREVLKDAFEVALLSTISHPNIIQMHTFFTDVVKTTSRQLVRQASEVKAKAVMSLRPANPGMDGDKPPCTVLVMEYCDRGSLRDAIRSRCFFTPVDEEEGVMEIEMVRILKTLVELASGMKHLHAKGVIHCDLKPANILLKSSSMDDRGFVIKLTDFGLSKMIMDGDFIVNMNGSGTVTHLAPELMHAGSKITLSIDVYAFGVIMWEMYTCKAPYKGMNKQDIMVGVCYNGLRPEFPADTPEQYEQVAKSCWAQEPDERPSFPTILQGLQQLLDLFSPPVV